MLRVSKRQIGLLELLCEAAPEASGADALHELRSRLGQFRQLEPEGRGARFRGELRHYQAVGLGFLRMVTELGFGACLTDDMGLGKTNQVLASLHWLHGSKDDRHAQRGRDSAYLSATSTSPENIAARSPRSAKVAASTWMVRGTGPLNAVLEPVWIVTG